MDNHVESLQTLCFLRKLLDGIVVGEVEWPDFNDAWGFLFGVENFVFCGFAFGSSAAGDYDFGSIEADKVASSLETQTDIGAGDDDSFVGELARGIAGSDKELGIPKG